MKLSLAFFRKKYTVKADSADTAAVLINVKKE